MLFTVLSGCCGGFVVLMCKGVADSGGVVVVVVGVDALGCAGCGGYLCMVGVAAVCDDSYGIPVW